MAPGERAQLSRVEVVVRLAAVAKLLDLMRQAQLREQLVRLLERPGVLGREGPGIPSPLAAARSSMRW